MPTNQIFLRHTSSWSIHKSINEYSRLLFRSSFKAPRQDLVTTRQLLAYHHADEGVKLFYRTLSGMPPFILHLGITKLILDVTEWKFWGLAEPLIVKPSRVLKYGQATCKEVDEANAVSFLNRTPILGP
jgi:hypothetical protein